VCVCAGVTSGTLCDAVNRGCNSVAALREQTGAGRGCGGCLPQLIDFLDPARTLEARDPTHVPAGARVSPGLGLLGATALAGVAATLAGPALPLSAGLTVVRRWPEVLWTDTRLQTLTGYALLGVFALAMLLPLIKLWGRRRLAAAPQAAVRIQSGGRLFHAAVGLAAVALGLVHSGGRLGANFNVLLAASTAALLGLGAVSTVMVAGALRSRLAVRLGTGARLVHMALLWPVLALVGIHLFAVLTF